MAAKSLAVLMARSRTGIAVLILAAVFQTSCARKDVPTQCSGTRTWNENAFNLYKAHAYKDALHAIETAPTCLWRDNQIVFDSYLILFLETPTQSLKTRALGAVSMFEKSPDWFADPGPLLVALDEDAHAVSWYTKAMDHSNHAKLNNSEAKQKAYRVRNDYYGHMISDINSPAWKQLTISEKLHRVADTQHEAIERQTNSK